MLSWSNLLVSCPPIFNVAPIVRMAYTNNIYMVRDLCLEGDKNGPVNQKPFKGKLDYDYIMWIDSDSVFEVEQFKILLDQMENDKRYHILSGIYLLEDGRYSAHFDFSTTNKEGPVLPQDIKNLGKKPFKVLYSGMGFMIVRKGVFESLSYPWFMPFAYVGQGGAQILAGDDASFCMKAQEAGFDILVDPKVIIGHEKMQVLK